jgi:hypothetical protein
VRADLRARGDVRTAEQRGPRTDARALTDGDGVRQQALEAHRDVDVVEAMVEVDEDDLVGEQGARPDLHALVGDHDAPVAEHGTGADDDLPAADVEAAAVAERRAVAHDHACAGSDVEAHVTADGRASLELDTMPVGQRGAPLVAPARAVWRHGRRGDGGGHRTRHTALRARASTRRRRNQRGRAVIVSPALSADETGQRGCNRSARTQLVSARAAGQVAMVGHPDPAPGAEVL